MKNFKLFGLLFICFLQIQCKKEPKKQTTQITASTVKYAKGFDIINKNGVKKLIIKRAFQTSEQQFEYILSDTKTDIKTNTIKVPLQRFVPTSTTHISMIEYLQSEDKIVGFPNTKYISSTKTRKLIDTKKIKDIGSEQDMNTEMLLDLSPDLVIGFSLHPNNKVYENIKKMGVPVVFNGEWLEETPLGRAEWIKFFGALLNKEQQADSIFKMVETDYLNAKKIAKNATKHPTVMSGSLFKDVWYAPAGKSFIASLFKDANVDYLWSDTNGTGSLSLNLENVLDKAQNADFWIGCGSFTSTKDLLQSNNHYQQFLSFKHKNVFGYGAKRGKIGGLIYFEESPIRPDLVLKDIIKITHPELLKNYQLHFYTKLK